MTRRSCKGCGSTTRKLSKPGPRCAECWRAETKRRRKDAHEKRVQSEYGLKPGEYDRLLELQGGVCGLCARPPGRKKLAVDHDHATGKVRGLLHTNPCNYEVLGIAARDDVEFFRRGIEYLTHPPYERLDTQANDPFKVFRESP